VSVSYADINIIDHRPILTDMKQLTDKGFMLIPTEAVVNHLAKLIPTSMLEFAFSRLKPTCCWSFHVHRGHAHPQSRLQLIHIEVVLAPRTLQLWILTTEYEKPELRKAAITRTISLPMVALLMQPTALSTERIRGVHTTGMRRI
jgi:hypothetical protein